MSEFEEILEEVGSFGPLQIQVFILVSMFETPAAWGLFVHSVFAAIKPPWYCDDRDSNVTMTTQLQTFKSANGTVHEDWRFQNCSLYGSSQCNSVIFDISHRTIVTEWGLICDDVGLPSKLISVLEKLGVLVGACVTGQLADMYGRKKLLFETYGMFLVFGLASGLFANSWVVYLVLRILIGMCFGGVMVVNFVLPLEFVGARWRTFCGCIGFWACGVMSLSLLAYFIRDWRYLTVTCYALGVPLMFTWWFIPESPRWLLLNDRRQEAEEILTNIARRNNRDVPDFSKLQDFVQRERQRRRDNRQYTYCDLCRTWTMTRASSIVIFAWFVCSSVYYGTTLGAKDLHGNRYLNFFLSGIVEIPPLIFVVLVNNRIGRRKTLSFLLMVSGLSCVVVLIVQIFDTAGSLMAVSLAFALLGKSGIAGSWAAAQVSSAEIFPTVVRNIGIGSCAMAARVGLIVAPEIVSLGAIHPSIPYIVFGAFGILCAVLCLFLPETLNAPLPDTLPDRKLCPCLGRKQPHLASEIKTTVTEVATSGEPTETDKCLEEGYV